MRSLYLLVIVPCHLIIALALAHRICTSYFTESTNFSGFSAKSVDGYYRYGKDARVLSTDSNGTTGTPKISFPAFGQHILMDIYQGDSVLFNDKPRLVNAMTSMVDRMGMTVLGVVGQELLPQGVSVTIALKESHFTVHTYPEVGTAFVDMFTCGDRDLLSNLPLIAGVFGADIEDSANVKWAFYQRGVAKGKNQSQEGLNDLIYELSYLPDEKKLLHSHQSRYQKIDIWAFKEYDYWFDDGADTVWGKALFMDGTLQSATIDEYKYHESLVHPAMLSHVDGAKRVAILGGGEGATLREVLKYTSVEYVEMIEIDPGIVEVAKDHLPEYHNCSFLVHSTSPDAWNGFYSCFDDPRVHIRYEDAVEYFHRLARRIGTSCYRSKKTQAQSSSAAAARSVRPNKATAPQPHAADRRLTDANQVTNVSRAMPSPPVSPPAATASAGVSDRRALAAKRSGGGGGGGGRMRQKGLWPASRGKRGKAFRRNRRSDDHFSVNPDDLPYRTTTRKRHARGQNAIPVPATASAARSRSSNSVDEEEAEAEEEGFDVIIMDLLDPEDHRVDLVDKLYLKDTLASLVCSLRPDGIIVTQFGQAPSAEHPRHHVDARVVNGKKINILSEWSDLLDTSMSVTSQMFLYNGYIPSFNGVWSFALFFSSRKGPNNFHRNAASTDMAIRKRIRPSARPLLYIDGTSMEAYSKLPREWQDAYCLQKQRPAMCDLFNLPSQEDASDESVHEPFVTLRPSRMHTDIGQANRWEVAAKVDIPKWTDLGLYDAATSIRMSLDEYDLLEDFVDTTGSKEYKIYFEMVDRYGYECNDVNGQYIYCSHDSKNTFVNHGCDNISVNTGSVDRPEVIIPGYNDTQEAEDDDDPWELYEVDDFNLVVQRHERHWCAMSLALRDIKKGEEILEDYGAFGDSWKPPKSWCNATD